MQNRSKRRSKPLNPWVILIAFAGCITLVAAIFVVAIVYSKTGRTPIPQSGSIIPTQTWSPTLEPTLTTTPEVASPSPTVTAPSAPFNYQVNEGDTLESISIATNVSVNDLRAANFMVGDTILTGQFITIPSADSIIAFPWKFSITSDGFDQDYPLALDAGRFILHYQPNTFPSKDPNVLAQMEMNGLLFLESFTGLELPDTYNVYVAGSNFESPNRPLRGITFSSQRKTFFLHDGTGNADDQQYIAAHELTHLFMWNTLGSPSSTMISEGMAVYTGMELIRASDHMPIEEFCAMYLQADALPKVSGSLSFLGHITDLQNYYASGCFVKYLADTYGMDSLKRVYHTGDYTEVYGKSLPTLESEWRDHLATVPLPEDLHPAELVDSVSELENNYQTFFSTFTGAPTQLEAYRQLDNARIALLRGHFTEMHDFLNAFKEIQ